MLDGYGINGSGQPAVETWWGGRFGLPPDARDVPEQDVRGFMDDGAKVWAEMERLRVEWKQRLDESEK